MGETRRIPLINMSVLSELKIRPLTQDDLSDLFNLTSNEEVARYMRFETNTDISQAKVILDEYLQNKAYAVMIKNKFAGVFVLKQENEETEKTYSMSTFLAKEYWNKGYTSYLLVHIKSYARKELNAKYLKAYVVDANKGSSKALINNGFLESEVLHFPDLDGGLIIYKCEL